MCVIGVRPGRNCAAKWCALSLPIAFSFVFMLMCAPRIHSRFSPRHCSPEDQRRQIFPQSLFSPKVALYVFPGKVLKFVFACARGVCSDDAAVKFNWLQGVLSKLSRRVSRSGRESFAATFRVDASISQSAAIAARINILNYGVRAALWNWALWGDRFHYLDETSNCKGCGLQLGEMDARFKKV